MTDLEKLRFDLRWFRSTDLQRITGLKEVTINKIKNGTVDSRSSTVDKLKKAVNRIAMDILSQ